MIKRPTVLVLGAGASASYGFPLGRVLLLQVCENLAEGVDSPLKRHLHKYGFKTEDLKSFERELRLSMQPSVDAFLEKRPEYMKIGKAAIAAHLMPYENPENLLRRDNRLGWYQYLFNQLDSGKIDFNFKENKLSIITFNYDRSLEYFLFTAVKNSYGVLDDEAVTLLNDIPIIHVYGKLGEPHFFTQDGRDYNQEVNDVNLRKCISEISIIKEVRGTSPDLKNAHNLIINADVLCFLGFGYHVVNIQRLDIDSHFKGTLLYGTTYGLGMVQIDRIASFFKKDIKLGTSKDNILDFLKNYPVFN